MPKRIGTFTGTDRTPRYIRDKNEAIHGKTIKEIRPLVNRNFVISRIRHHDGQQEVELVNSETILHIDDKILVISNPIDIEAITVFFGKQVEMEWEQLNKKLISRRILITKPELNGKMLSQLKIRNNFGASITRINRSGVDLVASPHLQLQMGDRVTIVGSELAVTHAEKVLGNSMKRLNHPNLIPIFRHRIRMYLGKYSIYVSRYSTTSKTWSSRWTAYCIHSYQSFRSSI